MFRRVWAFIGRLLSETAEDFYGGPLHRLERAAAKSSRDALGFAAAAERAKLADGRQPPAVIVPPAPRRTPAEERRRIDDLPIP